MAGPRSVVEYMLPMEEKGSPIKALSPETQSCPSPNYYFLSVLGSVVRTEVSFEHFIRSYSFVCLLR